MSRLALTVALLAALSTRAEAHPMAPALLELRELDAGAVAVVWKTPRLLPSSSPLEPILPTTCVPQGERAVETTADAVVERWQIDCSSELRGLSIGAAGLGENAATALVRIALADGRSIRALLSERSPQFVVPERESRLEVFAAYLRLGVEHLAFGLDHLLFVLGLMLLVGAGKPLVAAITSFTAGHSVTLTLATLGIVSFPQPVAEAAIALSILALAVELENRRSGGSSRWARRPWIMSLGFGLLHGLGFAGALAKIGLPPSEIPLALFGFNAGIEVAQLAFVALLLFAALVTRGWVPAAPAWPRLVPAYAIGTLAAYWCFDRSASLLGS